MITESTVSNFTKQTPKAIALLIALTLTYCIQLVLGDGAPSRGQWLLLFTAMASLLVLSACYAGVQGRFDYFNGQEGKRRYLLGYIPYALGLYLFAIEGFWSLIQLFEGWSISVIVLAIFHIICGNMVVSVGYECIIFSEEKLAEPSRA